MLLLARIFCDAVVECLNFRIESFKRSSTLGTVLAERGIVASRHRLDELFEVGAADPVVRRMVDAVMRCTQQAKARSGGNRILTTLRRGNRRPAR